MPMFLASEVSLRRLTPKAFRPVPPGSNSQEGLRKVGSTRTSDRRRGVRCWLDRAPEGGMARRRRPGQDVQVAPDALVLADGRRLSWHEFGDPCGYPVIYTAGTPVSGLGGASYHEAARAAGLRWISPDKPGYGGSDYHRGRSLASWADDLAALAGQLRLGRFALAGESGGAPFTLAAVHQLADRVSVVALIAAGGPTSPEERAGQQARIRFYGWLARNAPPLNAVPLTVMRWSLASPARRERALRRELAVTPPAKHASLRIEFDAVADALRQGTRAAAQEAALTKRPWPFPLREITAPVHLWHGERDTNAPIAIARRYASELPHATLHISQTSGHDIGHDRSEEITTVIASCAQRTTGH
jgi:pimeloyl-ACP methyl ester carboxylesterase